MTKELPDIRFLSSGDLAKALCVTRTTIRSWAKTQASGFPKSHRIGRNLFWFRDDVVKFLEKLEASK